MPNNHLDIALKIVDEIGCYDEAQQNEIIVCIVETVIKKRANQLNDISQEQETKKELLGELKNFFNKNNG